MGETLRKKRPEVIRPVVKSFNCPNCGATLSITAVGVTLSVVCKSCRSIIDANDPNYKILAKAQHVRQAFQPYIPIGRRGTVSGKVFECIGYMERADGPYEWREYLLFNPYVGFRWLFEMDGHWSILKKLRGGPSDTSYESVEYKSQTYKLFNKGGARVKYVEGEFYWRVNVGDKSHVQDYINPPYIISEERTKSEVNWTFGKYLEAEKVKKIFNLDEEPPYQTGVGPNQPSPVAQRFKEQIKFGFQAIVVLCFLAVLRAATADKEVLFSGQFYHDDSRKNVSSRNRLRFYNPVTKKYEWKDGTSAKIQEEKENSSNRSKIATSPEFEIRKHAGNLKLHGYANVRNNWVWLDVLLVNTETGKGVPMPMEISYYSGRDWKEGSRTNDVYEYNIPPGRYKLSIKSQSGGRLYPYSLTLTRDAIIGSNLIWCLIVIIVFPFFNFFRKRSFEVRRWSNSDYSPYYSEEDY